jgi:hypothetical protein
MMCLAALKQQTESGPSLICCNTPPQRVPGVIRCGGLHFRTGSVKKAAEFPMRLRFLVRHEVTDPRAAISLSAFSTPLFAEKVGPWDLDALKSNVPAMKWVRQDQPIQSLTYAGEKYQGHDTEVFAFYASPITIGEAKPGAKFPGVVLIHGGGGTAFADWVHLWAKRGYAAIAMDLNGSRPPDPEFDPKTGMAIGNGHRGTRTRLPNGGPPHGHPEKFDCIITPDTSDDWPFHAAASVMRAHTLLRSFP